jgi:hypothetical protein
VPDDRDHSLDRGSAACSAPGPTRRTLLGAALSTAVLAATSACSKSRSAPPNGGGSSGKGSADPDPGLLAGLRSAEAGLITQYDAVLAQFPELAVKLAPLRADHAGHLAAAGGTAPASAPAATPTPTPAAGASATALAGLAGAERAAANSRIGDCGTAHGPELARLLASIGGCEAAHSAVLTDLARTAEPAPRKTRTPAPAKTPGAVE